ncbi:MAG: trehalose-phosphatase [Acidimicrobiales bacterium]
MHVDGRGRQHHHQRRVGPVREPLLAPLFDDPGRAAVICDFDGTLAPIVADPAQARPLPGAVELLHRLAVSYAAVAVVSGRPLAFLAEHLRLTAAGRLRAWGAYGLEPWGHGAGVGPDRLAPWRLRVAEVAARADAEAPPGVLIERKGLSVTVHYRTAPAAQRWARRFAGEQAARTGLALHPARMSEELRPPVAVDKGTVVSEVGAGMAAVCFVGDDLGDLPAFAALDTLSATAGVICVKVAVASSEVPAALLEGADLVVDGPGGALELLTSLVPDGSG